LTTTYYPDLRLLTPGFLQCTSITLILMNCYHSQCGIQTIDSYCNSPSSFFLYPLCYFLRWFPRSHFLLFISFSTRSGVQTLQ